MHSHVQSGIDNYMWTGLKLVYMCVINSKPKLLNSEIAFIILQSFIVIDHLLLFIVYLIIFRLDDRTF